MSVDKGAYDKVFGEPALSKKHDPTNEHTPILPLPEIQKLKDEIRQLQYQLEEEYEKVDRLGDEVDKKDILIKNIKRKIGRKAFNEAKEANDEKSYHIQQIISYRGQLEEPKPLEWLVKGYFVKNKPSIIFGKGGTGKTTASIGLAMSSSMGVKWMDMPCAESKVLFIDFEQDEEEFRRKCMYISNGINKGGKADQLDYWSPEVYLPDELFWDILNTIVDGEEYDLVIIDSLSVGCNGGEMFTPEVVTPVMNHASRLPATVIFIDHPAKNGSDPYGSVFKLNQARSVLHLVKDDDTKVIKASLMKENFSGDRPPFSFEIKYSSCRDLPGRDEHNVIEFEVVETIGDNWYKYEGIARQIEFYMDENGGIPGTSEEIFEARGGEDKFGFKLSNFDKKLKQASKPVEEATKMKGCNELQIFHKKRDKQGKGRAPHVYTTYRRIGPKNEKEIETSAE